jgi:hypothetical protein
MAADVRRMTIDELQTLVRHSSDVLATHRSEGQMMSKPHLGTRQTPGAGFLSGGSRNRKSYRESRSYRDVTVP